MYGVARVVKRFYYLDMAHLEFTGDKNSYLRCHDNNDNLYIVKRSPVETKWIKRGEIDLFVHRFMSSSIENPLPDLLSVEWKRLNADLVRPVAAASDEAAAAAAAAAVVDVVVVVAVEEELWLAQVFFDPLSAISMSCLGLMSV